MSTFTEKELEIANKSYTNKDFEAIYLELLETAEKISKRFSPTSANEADPFIILLKLIAAVSDKINYNIDKNILERFLLSCTQEKSMRELTDMLGYSMRYYQSAETSVIFKYDFTGDPDEVEVIEIPAFSTITNGDNIQYITVENARIQKSEGASTEISVIQGRLKELSILGNNIIQLENLNANNRLYLPEVRIAENGISVNNATSANSWKSWTASDNLNANTYGSTVYKFGFDSVKNLPYLDFPDWIADIIGEGLSIKYLVTDGSAGNVAAKTLKNVSRFNASNDNIKDEDIKVINLSAATSGSEPETMSDAYRGCKKIIGTFDTLVTCRDYANKIYNMLNIYGNPYVSNVQVGDRRTDINYSCDVVTATNFGAQTKSKISFYYDELLSEEQSNTKFSNLQESDLNKVFYVYDSGKYFRCKYINDAYIAIELSEDELVPQITPYDLCIYGLRPIANTSYLAVDDATGYNKSYDVIRDPSELGSIQLGLEENKSMPHLYKDLKNSDIGYIQNLYKLYATINTSRKVNILEQQEILVNVNNALISKYNPRNLQFGNEIAFDELLEVIEQADPRIKSVSLQEPDQSPRIILANNSAVNLYTKDGSASDYFKFIVAKNLLSGRVEAFEYDTDFDYTFYQRNARKYKNMVKAKTNCYLTPFPAGTVDQPSSVTYILNDNEVVQFLAPCLRTEVTYPYGINYYLKLATDGADVIKKNSEYRLQSGDELVFTYTNNNDEVVIVAYTAGPEDAHIIKPNFDMYTSAYRAQHNETPTKVGVSNDDNKNYSSDTYKFYTLTSNQTVEYKKFAYDTLQVYKKCYWLTQQANNEILWERSVSDPKAFTYVLADGEYFFYSDPKLTSLFAYGAGTRLKLNVASETAPDPVDWQHNNYITVDSITENGLSALGDYFIGKSFDKAVMTLDIFENEIITITSGDTLQITNSGDVFTIEDNTFRQLPANVAVKYKFDGDNEEFNSLPDRSSLMISDAAWQVRSLLDLNVGPDSPQTLVGNQQITFIPGVFDETDERYVSFDDIYGRPLSSLPEGATLGQIHLVSGDTFESTSSIITSGGSNINLQFMDLDLKYKCPSILKFNLDVDPILDNLNTGFYSTSFTLDPDITKVSDTMYTGMEECTLQVPPVDYLNINTEKTVDIDGADAVNSDNFYLYLDNKVYYDPGDNHYYKCTRRCAETNTEAVHDRIDTNDLQHTYVWEPVENVYPSTRMFMIHIDGADEDTQLVLAAGFPSIRMYNKTDTLHSDSPFSSELILHNGINIIEVTDSISGTDVALCDTVNLSISTSGASAEEVKDKLASVGCLISKFKVKKGLNPLLGLSESDDIIQYIKTNFNEQFKEFFICADLDQAKQIELSEDYQLDCAQAFYDSNNIANKWVMCKIDFPSSSIKIAKSSRK